MNRRELLQAALAAPVASLVPSCLIAPASTAVVRYFKATPAKYYADGKWHNLPGLIPLWPQTADEIERGVWPYNPAYPPGHVLRYT